MAENVYVASSWRNTYQPAVVEALRAAGHGVYDFRNPNGGTGFSWRDVDPEWFMGEAPPVERYRSMLAHPIARRGYESDLDGMERATVGVLVLPSGRSAHLEAGWLIGAGRRVVVYVPEPIEPELMYLLAGRAPICVTIPEVVAAVGA